VAKYIRFEKAPPAAVAENILWKIVNKRADDVLGVILWYPLWKKHVCQFNPDSVWSRDCLVDVAEFMETLTSGDSIWEFIDKLNNSPWESDDA